jgi:putative spermidine/putrescine transport system ATP-binding protein
VTHDQEEALAMGDRVGVMSAGRLEQIAPPAELYDRPQTRFVAEFVGLTNRIPARTDGTDVDVLGRRIPLLPGAGDRGDVHALVRPENVRVTPAANADCRVLAVSFLGSLCRAQVALPDETIVVAQMAASESSGLYPGVAVDLVVAPAPVFVVAN